MRRAVLCFFLSIFSSAAGLFATDLNITASPALNGVLPSVVTLSWDDPHTGFGQLVQMRFYDKNNVLRATKVNIEVNVSQHSLVINLRDWSSGDVDQNTYNIVDFTVSSGLVSSYRSFVFDVRTPNIAPITYTGISASSPSIAVGLNNYAKLLNGDDVHVNWLVDTGNYAPDFFWGTSVVRINGQDFDAHSYQGNVDVGSPSSGSTVTLVAVARDGAEHQSAETRYSFIVDNDAPSLVTVPSFSFVTNSWYNAQSVPGGKVWRVTANDDKSGIDPNNSVYQLAVSSMVISGITDSAFQTLSHVASGFLNAGDNDIAIPENSPPGFYYIRSVAKDKVGNSSGSKFAGPFLYDNTPPTMSGSTTVLINGGGKLDFSWARASETLSGLATMPYRIYYGFSETEASGPSAQVLFGSSSTTSTNLDIPAVFDDRVVYFQARAMDNAGNEAVTPVVSLPIPQPIAFSASFDASASNTNTLAVKVGFGLTLSQLQRYGSITINRTAYGATLPNLELDPTTIPNQDGVVQPTDTWGVDAGLVYYKDMIQRTSGAGHKDWSYSIKPYPAIAPNATPQTVRLPNTPGTLTFEIKDMQGHRLTDPDFRVFENGLVNIVVKGSDLDRDSWQLEADKISEIRQSVGDEIYTFTSYQKLSGDAPLVYAPSGADYPEISIPVQLPSGQSGLVLAWTEGGGQSAQSFETTRKLITLEKHLSGEFTLQISDLEGNSQGVAQNGITTRPGQQLDFTVNAQFGGNTADIEWDFGDPDPIPLSERSGPTQSHAYHQATNQITDRVAYTLTIKLPVPSGGTVNVSIPVNVIDTQEGALYESEVWKGPHTVKGIVLVRSATTLTVFNGTDVRFEGGIGAGYMQGITVERGGTLVVANSTSFDRSDNQTKGWGTILVKGTATLGTADAGQIKIQNADRGLTIASGATVIVTRASFKYNAIGVHTIGASTTTITDSEITNSSVYGIKEDSGGRPILVNCMLGKSLANPTGTNFRNYYSQTHGLLSISQINTLPGNSGNLGE